MQKWSRKKNEDYRSIIVCSSTRSDRIHVPNGSFKRRSINSMQIVSVYFHWQHSNVVLIVNLQFTEEQHLTTHAVACELIHKKYVVVSSIDRHKIETQKKNKQKTKLNKNVQSKRKRAGREREKEYKTTKNRVRSRRRAHTRRLIRI